MAIAHRAEHPGALRVAVMLHIQHPVDRVVGGVYAGVLGVEKVDGPAQGANGPGRVNALPEEVGGVHVGANHLPSCRPQLQQGFRVVDAEARVHFQRHLVNALGLHKRRFLLPVGDQHLLPLVFQHRLIVLRPGTGDPVGLQVLGAAPGTAGKAHHPVHAQFSRQAHRVLKVLMKGAGHSRVRVHRVAVGGQGRNGQVVVFQDA